MARAPFQVLVLPYRFLATGEISYAVFRREPSTGGYWQGIAGGGEDDETPLQAARREAQEEAGITTDREFLKLETFNMIPVEGVSGFLWGEKVLVIPQYFFGVLLENEHIRLSEEHTEYRWLDYESARDILYWGSNRNALWELNYRLTHPDS